MLRMMTNVIPSQSQFRFLSRIEDQGGIRLYQLSDCRIVTNKQIGINCMPSNWQLKTLKNKGKQGRSNFVLNMKNYLRNI